MDKYRNNKSHKVYEILHEAIECTNSRAGETTIVYKEVDPSKELIFTREAKEFYNKFTKIEN